MAPKLTARTDAEYRLAIIEALLGPTAPSNTDPQSAAISAAFQVAHGRDLDAVRASLAERLPDSDYDTLDRYWPDDLA